MHPALVAASTAVAWLARVLAALCAALAGGIMVLIAADVARRGFTGRVIPGAMEYTEIAMVALVFLGLSYAQACRSHIGIAFIVEWLPRRPAQVLRLLGQAATLVIMAWLIVETSRGAIASYAEGEYRFGLAQVPIWPARCVIPLGLAAYFLQLVLDFVASLTGTPEGPPDVHAS